jgi:hypothetical protein
LVAAENEYFSRAARRILQERQTSFGGRLGDIAQNGIPAGQRTKKIRQELASLWESSLGAKVRLRTLWAMHTTVGLAQEDLLARLKDPEESIRAWTIQLACEDKKASEALLKEFARLAKEDPSPVVRLYLASACQRLSVEQRLPILENLLAHAEDAEDHNLPLMYWYAAEAVAAQGAARAAPLLLKTKIPKVREFITKRMTAAASTAAASR